MFRLGSARTVALMGAVGASVGAGAMFMQQKKYKWQPIAACDAKPVVASTHAVDTTSAINAHSGAHDASASHHASSDAHHVKSSQAVVIDEAIKEQQRSEGDVEAVVDSDNAEEVDTWEEQKKHCSFCKHFIESPCKMAFKKWSICVENAKNDEKDFVTLCSQATSDLVECTSKYPEYFREAAEKTESEEADGDDSLEHDTK